MNSDTDLQIDSQSDSPKRSIRVTATEESPVAYSLAVEVDAERVGEAFQRAYRDLGKKVRVKGFRPGKVPRSVLEKLYAASIAEQLEHTLVAESLGEAIEQSGVHPVTEPAIDAAPPAEGADFAYTVRVEVKPRFTLPETAGLPAIRPAVDVTDEEVAEQLEALRTRNAPAVEEPEDTEIEEGHVLAVDFVGRIDGEPFEGGSGQDVELEVGSGQFLPGFEDQLVGARAGDDVEVRVTFPERYGNSDLAGKEAVFACHVAAVKKRQIPELDDEFAKDLGNFESLEELRLRIRGDLMEARERESKQVLRTSLMDALVERTEFEVPPGMVERQLDRQIQAAHQRLQGQVPEEAMAQQLEQWREQWRDQAEREVREMLILEAVAEAQGIEVDPSEIEARIAAMVGGQPGVDPAVLQRAYGDEALARALRAQLVDEKALDFLVAEAKVEETTDT
jgi:trigger factor